MFRDPNRINRKSHGDSTSALQECQTTARHCDSLPGSQEILHENVVGKI